MHFEDHFAAGGFQFDFHAGGVGVPDDIRQRLLKDAEHRGGAVRAELDVL